MKQERILAFFHHFRTPTEVGGLRSWHIGRYLVQNGYAVTAVVPAIDPLTGIKRAGAEGRLATSESIDGVELIWTGSTVNDRLSRAKRILYFLSASIVQTVYGLRVKEVDAVISTSLPLPMVMASCFAAWIRRVPFLIDVRDLSLDTAFELNYLPRNMVFRALQSLESWVYRRADMLLTISEGLHRELVKKGVALEKIRVVPIGYEKGLYDQMVDRTRDIKQELGLDGKFVVLYTGTIGFAVDIPTLLDAAKRTADISDIVFLLVGHGQRFHHYGAVAQELKLNCVFLDARPKMEIPLFCEQADVCVYPLRGEELIGAFFGNKVFDYLGSGTPVIYSGPKGDIQRLLLESGGGICVAGGDGEALAKGIIALYRDPQQGEALGRRGKQFAELELNVDLMMKRFGEAVSETLSRQPLSKER